MASLLSQYLYYLDAYPIATKCVTSILITAASDCTAQTFEMIQNKGSGQTSYNFKRTLRMISWGVITVPIVHRWYNVLERLFPAPVATSVRENLIPSTKKMFFDQATFAPISLLIFMTYISSLEGNSWQNTRAKIAQDYKSILWMNYKVWIPIQYLNFFFIPLQHRILLAQMVGFLWTIYLSHMQNSHSTPIEELHSSPVQPSYISSTEYTVHAEENIERKVE